jgi:S-DNA-T family DNA segregation ATPase FtsK/SpoIIIE
MANTVKNKKAVLKPVPVSDASPINNADRKRQVRLGFGIFFLLSGIFTCFAIISYFFTWSIDQSNVLQIHNLGSFFHFVFQRHTADTPAIANSGGHLGAALSHVLVWKGAGIASLAIGIGIAAIGVNLLYEKRAIPVLRYMRWISLLLLLIAPILAYLLPHNPFPLGGALGNFFIEYLNGVLGYWGTGMLLLSTVLFFVFVIFALDIKPLLNRIKQRTNKMAAALAPEPVFNEPANPNEDGKDAINAPFPADPSANQLNNDDGGHPVLVEDKNNNKELEMTLTEKEKKNEEELNTENIEEDDVEDEEFEAYQKFNEEKEAAGKAADEHTDPEFSFEVIQQVEKPAIKHGSHIAIANNEPYAPELDLPDYKFPTLNLLEDRAQETISLDKEELEKNKNQIIQTLRSFGIEIQRISATVGPTVTLYEIVPSEGVRISKIRNLEDDIALNLAALGIRIIAPIPGRGTIGIEVPNANKQIVNMRTLIASDKFVNNKMSLPIALGKKIDNENYIVDLATMPHLLMAGATGQGKSVGINAILVSLLYKKHPSQLKFIMVDPKKVELSIYRTIEKHFLAKLPNEEEAIITDTKKVINTLNALCIEMDNRYELLKEAGARNIKEYNEKFISRRLNPERGHKYLPFIVLVIDEFADLIMTAGKEVEMPIARLAQLARAIGIHLIIATQRPSVNVITGTIKANFPARIAFKVSAKVDSRTILDAGGAEQLIGRGDMLVSHGSELLRLQCAFVDTPEVEQVVDFIGKQRGYASAFELPEYEGEDGEGAKEVDLTNRDKLFEDCARIVVQMQSGSTSNLQRRLNLGYNRAGRIMDQLEAAGVVGPANGSKPREVYFKTESELDSFLHSLD